MLARRLTVVLASAALLLGSVSATVTPAASAASSRGSWSGTITMTSVGMFDYRIGYRGSGTTTSQATSHHELGWTLRFDNVQGDSDLTSAYLPGTLVNYRWSGSATAPSSGCGYTASGSMDLTDASNYFFAGMSTDGAPGVATNYPEPAALSVSRPAGDCYSRVTFGFSGPNAGTLGDNQWWDAYLLNPSPPEPSQYPELSLCWHPRTLSPAPVGEDHADGTRRVAGTSSGSCDGTKVEWFGDSDVSHVMDVDVSYTYDLTFVPDVGECDDGEDNDGDGYSDHAADPGCDSAEDPTELGMAECDNGIDDDGDGFVDYRLVDGDPSCISPLGVESSSCDLEATDHLVSSAAGKARWVVAAAPDLELGSFDLRVLWCTTPEGARIKDGDAGVDATATLTDNWIVLGALETAGFDLVVTEPEVSRGQKFAAASGHFYAEFSPLEAALNFFPVSRGLDRIAGYIDECFVNVANGMRPARALREMMTKVTKRLDEMSSAIEDRLARRLNRLPGVSQDEAERIADRWVTDPLEDAVSAMKLVLKDKVSIGDEAVGAVRKFVKKTFESAFALVDFTLWRPNVTIAVQDGGTHQFLNESLLPGFTPMKQKWTDKTVT